MNIYDTITADQIEEGDLIVVSNDYIEVSFKLDETDIIMVKGFSHLTGDNASYLLNPDTIIDLWSA